MQRKTIRKVLENEEVLDIALTAKAILEINKRPTRKDKISSRINSSVAYKKFQERMKEAEDLRQKVIKVWNKRKK